MARIAKPWFRKERNAWFVILNGEWHNLGPDKKLAHQKFHQLMSEPAPPKLSPHSLPSVVDEFLEWVQQNRAASNYEGYRFRLQRFVSRYPNLAMGEVRPYHVEKWAASYKFSKTTRRNYMRAVKRCFRWAKQQGYLDTNPIADLEVPVADNRKTILRTHEFTEFLAHVRDESFKDLLVATWETGCRPQEILKITADHVDLDGSRWVLQKSEAKMQRAVRVIYLGEKSLEITGRLMQRYPNGPIFRNSRGKPWTTSSVNCAFRRVRIRIGKDELDKRGGVPESEIVEFAKSLRPTRTVKGKTVTKTQAELHYEAKWKLRNKKACAFAPQLSLYTFRHSFATNALERGLDTLTVAQLMGHSNGTMLAKVYAHLSHNSERLLEQARKANATD